MPGFVSDPIPSPRAGEAMDRRIEKAHPGRRKLLGVALVGVAVAAVLALAAVIPRTGSLLVHSDQIQTATVQRAPFQDDLPVRGEVAPARTVYVGAVSGGQVERVVAADGAEVATGEILATLSNPQLQLDVIAREAEISGRLGDASGQQLGLQTASANREHEIADAEYGQLRAEHELLADLLRRRIVRHA